MSKHVETTHPQKIMGLYVNLKKALDALDAAGEDVRGYDGLGVVVRGITASVEWTSREQGFTVVQA